MSFRRILAATDGSPTGTRGVREAIALAVHEHAELSILHVVSFHAAVAEMQMAGEALFEQHLETLRRQGGAVLDAAAAEAAAAGLTPRTLLRVARVARAAEAIVAEARGGYDLLVIGTHGRSGWQRFTLGSQAEEVLRTASVPVLLVRAPESAASA